MSFNARNRYDPSRRRRRRNIHNHSSSSHSHITRLATTAALAYGAYRLGSWAWDSYFGKDNYDNDEENYVFGEGSGYDSESESESDDYDDACAQSSRPNGNDDDEPSRKDLRSRRSRGDWSKYNHRHRSHPHSPHHHHHDNATTNKNGSKSNNNNSVGSSVGEKIMTSTTAAIGAAVSAGISAGINAYNNNNNNVASAQFIRSSRMERCRLETSRAMMDFLPTLKKAIVKETDITSEMEELKSIRTQKKRDLQSKNGDGMQHQLSNGDNDLRERERELWNNIKNKSITRLVTTIYAHTIVFLVLTVQVNLLGGRLLREEQEKNHHQQQEEDDKDESLDEQSSDDESDRYRSSHKTVLAKTYHHVFAKGIPSLAAAVAKAVDDALQNWDVLGGDDASLDDVSSWLETVRDVIEKRQEKGGNNSSSSTTGALVQFVIPDEMGQSNDEPMMDDLARYILDETYDLLESPTYAHAERLCLDITFTNLREEGYANLFPSPTRRNNKHVNEAGDGAVERKPLAKVITHLSKPTVATFYETPSHKAEMDDWEGVFKMMEEPLPSSPNVYIPNLSHAVTELSDICFN